MSTRHIATGRSRRPTRQREIASRAGVSISTVSRVLNDVGYVSADAQRRVLSAAAELGYAGVSRSDLDGLKRVGVFVPASIARATSAGFLHADIVAGVEAECRKDGLHLGFTALPPGLAGIDVVHNEIERHDVEGLLLLSITEHELVENILGFGVPAVLINAVHPTLPIDTILPDSQGGVLHAMEYLIALGHRHIMHATHVTHRPRFPGRHELYRFALETAGIPYDPALVIETPLDDEQGAYTAMAKALSRDLPHFTAVFCFNDRVAVGVMRALQEAGRRIPDDVSIVGFDDTTIAAFLSPPLTTVRVERELLGALAVRRLLERSASPDLIPIRVELATRLIERQSATRANPASISADDP